MRFLKADLKVLNFAARLNMKSRQLPAWKTLPADL